jgi:hypothetical protein
MAAAVDGRHAAAGDNEEPLIGATMPIRRIAFGFARLQHHRAACDRLLPRTTLKPLPNRSDLRFMEDPV